VDTFKRYEYSFLDHEDGLDDGVHLMHVSAGPHDPHADRADDAGYDCHSRYFHIYWRLAAFA
jgi:hypothetical protein